jgi:hypothetical protein
MCYQRFEGCPWLFNSGSFNFVALAIPHDGFDVIDMMLRTSKNIAEVD